MVYTTSRLVISEETLCAEIPGARLLGRRSFRNKPFNNIDMSTEASVDLDAVYAPIQKDFDLLREFLRKEFASKEPFICLILNHISRFRGKQIRPALFFLTNRLAGGKATGDVVKIAAVLEMIHTATLVHDDLLDDARLRRSVETVHQRWGDRAAVLIGDYVYSRAFQLSTQVAGMAEVLSETTHTICEGELLQIGSRFVPDLSEETYFEIIRKKTAVLHAVSCRLGGVFAGLDKARCDLLYDFGMHLGTAFQIVDDCLDYRGDESVVGKSLGTDLRQGKVTLPIIYLREILSSAEAEWLDSVLRQKLDAEAEQRIRGLVTDHGVLPEAFQRASEFLQEAKTALVTVRKGQDSLSAAVVESLDSVAEYILRRQR